MVTREGRFVRPAARFVGAYPGHRQGDRAGTEGLDVCGDDAPISYP